ncbi:hypothetical protein SteCoe_26433 [Stentor coeruleus]|uniref:Uncharacterized protein n=1 Tax=Stentor coeruleus TaxID=5963 RepID=A0A1R2BCW3_9CILI|nr:hypothetical protein SteCoe_26433 [Stentor coeruleus]
MSEFCVTLDSTVVLQVIQHCQDTNDGCNGKLIGYESEASLVVVNSFAIPSDLTESDEYTTQRLKYFQDLKFESFILGWYTKSTETSFLDINTIEFQYNMQCDFQKAIMLVYNPTKALQGEFPLSAYCLTEAFMNFFADEDLVAKKMVDLNFTAKNVFVKLPVEVKNSPLVEGFLAQYGFGTEEKRIIVS